MTAQSDQAIVVFVAAFLISAIGGLGALLRGRRPLTWRAGTGSVLSSGLIGLIVSLLWYNHYEGQGNIYYLLGVSGCVGVTGMTGLDLVLRLLAKGGVQIVVQGQNEDSGEYPSHPNHPRKDPP